MVLSIPQTVIFGVPVNMGTARGTYAVSSGMKIRVARTTSTPLMLISGQPELQD